MNPLTTNPFFHCIKSSPFLDSFFLYDFYEELPAPEVLTAANHFSFFDCIAIVHLTDDYLHLITTFTSNSYPLIHLDGTVVYGLPRCVVYELAYEERNTEFIRIYLECLKLENYTKSEVRSPGGFIAIHGEVRPK